MTLHIQLLAGGRQGLNNDGLAECVAVGDGCKPPNQRGSWRYRIGRSCRFNNNRVLKDHCE